MRSQNGGTDQNVLERMHAEDSAIDLSYKIQVIGMGAHTNDVFWNLANQASVGVC